MVVAEPRAGVLPGVSGLASVPLMAPAVPTQVLLSSALLAGQQRPVMENGIRGPGLMIIATKSGLGMGDFHHRLICISWSVPWSLGWPHQQRQW